MSSLAPSKKFFKKAKNITGKVPVKIQYKLPHQTTGKLFPVERIAWMLAGPIVHDWKNWLEEHPNWLEIDFTNRPPEIFDNIKPNSKTRMHEHWMGGVKGSVGEEHPVGRAHHREEIESEHFEEEDAYKENFDKRFSQEKLTNPLNKEETEQKKNYIKQRKKIQKEIDGIKENKKLTFEQRAKKDAEKDFLEESEVRKRRLEEKLEEISDELDNLENKDQLQQEYRDKYHIKIEEIFINPNFPPYGYFGNKKKVPAESSRIIYEGKIKEYDRSLSEKEDKKLKVTGGDIYDPHQHELRDIESTPIIQGEIADNSIIIYSAPKYETKNFRKDNQSHKERTWSAWNPESIQYYLFIRHFNKKTNKVIPVLLKNIEKYDNWKEVENRREELFSATEEIIKKFGSYSKFKEYIDTLPREERINFQDKWENKGIPLRIKYGLSNQILEKKIKNDEEEERERKQVEVNAIKEDKKYTANKIKKIELEEEKLKVKEAQKAETRRITKEFKQDNVWTMAVLNQLNLTNNYLQKRSNKIVELINGSITAGKSGKIIGYRKMINKLIPQIDRKKKELWTPAGKKREEWIKRPNKFKVKEYSYNSNKESLEKTQKKLEKLNKNWNFDKKTDTYIPTKRNRNAYEQYIFAKELNEKLSKKQQLENNISSKQSNIKSIKKIKKEINILVKGLKELRKTSGHYQRVSLKDNEKDLRKSIIENINNLEKLWKSSEEKTKRSKEKKLIIKKMNSLIGEWECDSERIQNADTFNALYSEFQSGEDRIKLEGEGNQYKVSTNGVISLVTEDFKEALAKYYSSVSRIMDSQNNNKDLALELFGEHVLNTSRNTRKLMAELDKMTEVKMLENLDYSQLSIPFNSDFIIKYEPQSDVFGIAPRTYDETEVECQNNPGGKIGRKDLKESDYEEIELHPEEQDPIEEEPSEPGIGTDGANLITKTDKPSLNQPQLLPYRQEENKRTEKVEAPIKVKETYSQNLHPPEEKVIEGQHGVD